MPWLYLRVTCPLCRDRHDVFVATPQRPPAHERLTFQCPATGRRQTLTSGEMGVPYESKSPAASDVRATPTE